MQELGDTSSAVVDLSTVKGLERCRSQNGPSTVGVDTIHKSHGKIPDEIPPWVRTHRLGDRDYAVA